MLAYMLLCLSSDSCVYSCPILCVTTCFFFSHLSFLHARTAMNTSMLSAPMLACTPLLAWSDCVPGGWCVRAKQIRVFCGFISELWTLGYMLEEGQLSLPCLPKPFYNDWDGRSCLLSLLCSFETRKMTTQKDWSVLCTLTDSKFKSRFKWKYFLFVSWEL